MPFHKRAKPNPTLLSLAKGIYLIKVVYSHIAIIATSMASSSPSHQTLNDEKDSEKPNFLQEEEEGWLELGLGLRLGKASSKIVGHGSNPVSEFPSSSSCLKMPIGHDHVGLGFEKSSCIGPNDDEYYCHHIDQNGLGSFPTKEWDMPSYAPHHYCTRKPHESGLWFTLLSSTNRSGEALPQIPKAYIRVKDQNMTVFMVKKYLVRKLGLSNEDEIDISCMGENLSHAQTLKQVRDTVWLPRVVDSANSRTVSIRDSFNVSTNHLMSLLYQKNCSIVS